MYLRALEIQGFKSFPDKTVLNFGEDITAIVGPNGSGKSNISDAIRWVMGEQSVKGLRGAKMEDVIFGGTEKRSQVGFAQVTLVLDNTEHIFPTMEESEVSVTRRYYRSGESEYYINRQSVRLKDLTELFLDTGMGREGYSIIGQGKIDEILSAKSGERREIFEEAAGISKFRHRKEEAERKLERTEENLVRINDKIAELELQVEPLREQAEKARKYLVLRDELRLLEISVWLENLDTLKAGARKLEADFHAAESQRDEARAALDALYAEGERYSERMREKDMEAERVRTESAVLEEQIKEKESAAAVLESTVTHNRENIQRAEAELAEAESRSGGLAKQAEEQEARVAEIDRRIGELNGALAALLETAQTMAEQAGGAQNEAERLRAQEGGTGRRRRGEEADPGAAGGRRARQGRRGGAASVRPAGGAGEPPRPGGCQGRGGGRRQHHRRPQPADGGTEEEGRCRRGAAGPADHGHGGAGKPPPPADRDGEGVRGLLQGGQVRVPRTKRPAGHPWPGGQSGEDRWQVLLGHRDRPGGGTAEHCGGPGGGCQGRYQLPEAAGRRTGHVPAPHRHPG